MWLVYLSLETDEERNEFLQEMEKKPPHRFVSGAVRNRHYQDHCVDECEKFKIDTTSPEEYEDMANDIVNMYNSGKSDIEMSVRKICDFAKLYSTLYRMRWLLFIAMEHLVHI